MLEKILNNGQVKYKKSIARNKITRDKSMYLKAS